MVGMAAGCIGWTSLIGSHFILSIQGISEMCKSLEVVKSHPVLFLSLVWIFQKEASR
jgi:hypothetical protein